jgi:outer membrane lipoprotein SlyB
MRMRIALLSVVAIAATASGGCATYGDDRYDASYSAYDYNRPDPRRGYYDPSQYYRSGEQYREYELSQNDRIYRGRDGRYYCRRSDGSTGLIVGAAAGGALGAILAPGGSGLLGAILGGAAGAAIGAEVERGQVRCR